MADPRNILIFLRGVQGKTSVEDINAAGTEVKAQEQEFFDEMLKIAGKGQPPAMAKGWFGSIEGKDKTVKAAKAFLSSVPEYVPGKSKLIIYGYSAGGMNALMLTRSIDEINQSRASGNKIDVNLLITVDAAARAQTPLINRNCGDCVRRNLNYYQKTWISSWPNGVVRSEGGPNTGSCNPENNHLWSESHSTIYKSTQDRCLKAIGDALGVEVHRTKEPHWQGTRV